MVMGRSWKKNGREFAGVAVCLPFDLDLLGPEHVTPATIDVSLHPHGVITMPHCRALLYNLVG